jgi:hypothetical protein
MSAVRRDTLGAILWFSSFLYIVPAFAISGYVIWKARTIRGRPGWATHRSGLVMGVLWPVIVVLLIVNWCWTRFSKGRNSR